MVKVNSEKENHKTAFLQLQTHFEKLLNVEIDKSGKDITRLCFVSFDPEIYINTNAESFTCLETQKLCLLYKIFIAMPFISQLKKKAILKAIVITFIFLLANNLNRKGVSLTDALNLILSEYKYNDAEVTATIKSAYNNSFRAR